jgi:hypothetical protein
MRLMYHLDIFFASSVSLFLVLFCIQRILIPCTARMIYLMNDDCCQFFEEEASCFDEFYANVLVLSIF